MSVPQGIPGVKLQNEALAGLRREVAQLLHRQHMSFPGAQPVSFARNHLEELKKQDYYLCEKTDGIRCLLYCTTGDHPSEEAHYLIDRKNDYYYVKGIHLPQNEGFPGSFHKNTLIDGELVVDRFKDPRTGQGVEKLIYYVFDCLVFDGQLITDRTLDKRIGKFGSFVMAPLQKLEREYAEDVARNFPFRIKMKRMEKPYGAEMMFKEYLPKLPHANDGLVFTCRESPYCFGTDEKILKWKPAHENTIDFRLKLGQFPMMEIDFEEDGTTGEVEDWDAKPTFDLEVFHGDRDGYKSFAPLYIDDEEWEAMKAMEQHLDERIIECWKDDQKRWRFKHDKIALSVDGPTENGNGLKLPPDFCPRFRDDKLSANHISTVEKVLQSIDDAVSEDDLLRESRDIQQAWKARHPEEERVKQAAAQRAQQQQQQRPHSQQPPRPHMPAGHGPPPPHRGPRPPGAPPPAHGLPPRSEGRPMSRDGPQPSGNPPPQGKKKPSDGALPLAKRPATPKDGLPPA